MNLKLSYNQGECMFFKVRNTTPMQTVMDNFSERIETPLQFLKFIIDGYRIKGTDTPKLLELNDEDQIDVFIETIGGGADDQDDQDQQDQDKDNKPIMLRFRESGSQEETLFRVKATTKMAKIFNSFAAKKGMEATAFKFLFDGNHLKAEDTPKMYEMEDDDMIDVLLTQIGGRGSALCHRPTLWPHFPYSLLCCSVYLLV